MEPSSTPEFSLKVSYSIVIYMYLLEFKIADELNI